MDVEVADRPSFAQREGAAPPPPQLELKKLSKHLRALLWSCIYYDFRSCVVINYEGAHLTGHWLAILADLHIQGGGMIDELSTDVDERSEELKQLIVKGNYIIVLGLIESILRNQHCSLHLRVKLPRALIDGRAAYRVIDGDTIVPITSAEQAEAVSDAAGNARTLGVLGSSQHLKSAGVHLREGRWAESVRESIHAVESVAVRIDPGSSNTLGAALKSLGSKGHLNAALSQAFSKLYGYASDEAGISMHLCFRPRQM